MYFLGIIVAVALFLAAEHAWIVLNRQFEPNGQSIINNWRKTTNIKWLLLGLAAISSWVGAIIFGVILISLTCIIMCEKISDTDWFHQAPFDDEVEEDEIEEFYRKNKF